MKRGRFCAVYVAISIFFIQAVGASIKKAHLHGWYPENSTDLRKNIDDLLLKAEKEFSLAPAIDQVYALTVPHAGYIYSGLAAASAYQAIQGKSYKRVIILAPDHAGTVSGIAVPNFSTYRTPLGDCAIDQKTCAALRKASSVFSYQSRPFDQEHSIELQLPFLQRCLTSYQLIPLLVGSVTDEQCNEVAAILSSYCSADTLYIVTSDLTHFGAMYDYVPFKKNILSSLRNLDGAVIQAICSQKRSELDAVMRSTGATVCGYQALRVFLSTIAKAPCFAAQPFVTSYYSSAMQEKRSQAQGEWLFADLPDAAMRQSVGYTGIVWASARKNILNADRLTGFDKRQLFSLARRSIEKKLGYPQIDFSVIKTPGMLLRAGSFVTLYEPNFVLRGCIGRIITHDPLYETVIHVAYDAAFEDSRFKPVSKQEYPSLSMTISVLDEPHAIKKPSDIVLNKQGIILNHGGHTALFLPQVPLEFGWDLTTTLEQLAHKAGLPKDAWQTASYEVFDAVEIHESDLRI